MTPTYIPEDQHFRYYIFTHIDSEEQKVLSNGAWADDFQSATLWPDEDATIELARQLKADYLKSPDANPKIRFVVGQVKVESNGFYDMKVV